jgi:hypothetical protein
VKRFLHSGHIGDIIAFLPLMRKLGGGHIVITDHNKTPQLMMEGFKYESLKPLLECQDYISGVSFEKHPTNIDFDVTGFRKHWGKGTIIEMQAMELGVEPCIEKWLQVEPNLNLQGKIVCCRSTRYRNNLFPWRELIDKIRDRVVFIGVHDEYGNFVQNFGKVDRFLTNNCLEIAQAIAGSDMFIGNQSSPFWIAAGLHHPLIQETCLDVPDSIVSYNAAHYWLDDIKIINDILK